MIWLIFLGICGIIVNVICLIFMMLIMNMQPTGMTKGSKFFITISLFIPFSTIVVLSILTVVSLLKDLWKA